MLLVWNFKTLESSKNSISNPLWKDGEEVNEYLLFSWAKNTIGKKYNNMKNVLNIVFVDNCVQRFADLRSWGFGKPELLVNHEPKKDKTKFKLMTKTPIS